MSVKKWDCGTSFLFRVLFCFRIHPLIYMMTKRKEVNHKNEDLTGVRSDAPQVDQKKGSLLANSYDLLELHHMTFKQS